MISNCGHDENGKYSGGQAGDQTSDEWAIIGWYNRPWNVMLRHPDQRVQNDLAYLGRAAAQNDNIGYDQNQRTTYWTQLQKAGYDPAKITTKCEADCSSGVAANVKAAGYRLGISPLQSVSKDCYTGNLRAALKKAGFQEYTDSKYLTSDQYLLPGDILLYEGHHTATNLDRGSKAIVEHTEGFKQAADGARWWYQYKDGSWAANGWYWLTEATGGTSGWYLFDEAGYMLTGYQKDPDGEWFFLCPDKGIDEGKCMATDDRGVLWVPRNYDFENHKFIL